VGVTSTVKKDRKDDNKRAACVGTVPGEEYLRCKQLPYRQRKRMHIPVKNL
jgi:hypothetical protein